MRGLNGYIQGNAQSRLVVLLIASMLTTLVFACVCPASPACAYADQGFAAGAAAVGQRTTVESQSAKAGWVATKKGKSYYRNGKRLTGLQKIGKKRYYFNSKGLMKTGVITVGKVTYYTDDQGVLEGAKIGNAYYYNTFKRMTKADAYDFKIFQKAHAIVRSISKKTDSKPAKLKKAFDWVIRHGYEIHRNFSPHMTNWPAIYANDHFDNKGGDCHADGAAFAYLAAAIGYDADVCIDSMASGYAPSHCWTMIGPKVYDPLFAEDKSYRGFYGVTSGTYQVNPLKRYRVPEYNPKNAKRSARASKVLVDTGKVGLVEEGGALYYYKNGAKLKKAWITLNGARYYFAASGRAATLSTKIDGTYYVFNEHGRLVRPKATKNVRIGDKVYRVTPSGKAVSGWSPNGKQRFDRTGLLLCGICLVGKSLYAADEAGNYNAELTAQLKAASKAGQPAALLAVLLGKPKRAVYSPSCDFAGDDGLWMYDGFIVTTARPADGTPETIRSVQHANA